MHIVIAADSFKGSNNSLEVARAIREGFESVYPRASFQLLPVADGGEGTVEALVQARGGEIEKLRVRNALGKDVESFWGRLPDGKAVLEMAAASGLPMLDRPDAMLANTYGTGQLIRAALDSGARKIMVGVGGSATNDGGVGMAQALGASFLDEQGREIQGGGGSLCSLRQIDLSKLDSRLKECEILIACDVSNPLLGETGASFVYGPQKGANPQQVIELDAGLAQLASLVQAQLGLDLAAVPGAGAAGGLGYGLMAFCGGKLMPGVETVLRIMDFASIAAKADLVITGEGRLDGQSLYGKVPIGVAKWAKEAGKPVLAIVGELGAGAHIVFEHGIDALLPTVDRVMDLPTALSESRAALVATAERAARTLRLGENLGKT